MSNSSRISGGRSNSVPTASPMQIAGRRQGNNGVDKTHSAYDSFVPSASNVQSRPQGNNGKQKAGIFGSILDKAQTIISTRGGNGQSNKIEETASSGNSNFISGEIYVSDVHLRGVPEPIDLSAIRKKLFVGITSSEWKEFILKKLTLRPSKFKYILEINGISRSDFYDHRRNQITAQKMYRTMVEPRHASLGFGLYPNVAKDIAYLWAIKKADKINIETASAREVSDYFLRIAEHVNGKGLNDSGNDSSPIDLRGSVSLNSLVEYQLKNLVAGKRNGQSSSVFERELVAYSLLAHVARFANPEESKKLVGYVRRLAGSGDFSKVYIDPSEYDQKFEFYLCLASAHLDYLYALQLLNPSGRKPFLEGAKNSINYAARLLKTDPAHYSGEIYLPDANSFTVNYMNSFGAAIVSGTMLPSVVPC